MAARATLPPATNPILGGDLRVQTGLEVLLGVHVLAGFGFVDLDGLIVVDVLRGIGAGGGALTRGRSSAPRSAVA